MVLLATDLRKRLENVISSIRPVAEAAARVALTALAVERPEPFTTLTPEQRRLRNALRAKARQLGVGSQTQGFQPLVEEIAYQQWHRMLFARFLAENSLLMHPSGVPVTLADCAELAAEEGDPDAWTTAARYASAMLPGIFLADDPVVQVQFAPEGRYQLESLLNDLPAIVFTADDSIGWMYQFWQKNKKEEVNASERKIGGADLAPVTQLFTEDYMVRFLLENSLGAWWAARHPDSPLINEWEYLRWIENDLAQKTPAAGIFPGWPEHVAGVTVMDPCCGSGHFLVAAFDMLRKMRMEEEGLSESEAADVVLRDNLFGLELDPRCTQIAAFALALSAWKIGGYRQIPIPNVACSGIPIQGQLEAWLKLAGDDLRLRNALERLYNLFKNAPDLGSLINPADVPLNERMFIAEYQQVIPLIEIASKSNRIDADPSLLILGLVTVGLLKAIQFLAGKYWLVITNVPYLNQGKQGEILRKYCESIYPDSNRDLATCFVERSLDFVKPSGIVAVVTPHNWRFLQTYANLRRKLLTSETWLFVLNLGPKAFTSPLWDFNIGLSIIQHIKPTRASTIWYINASLSKSISEKLHALINQEVIPTNQYECLTNRFSAINPKAHPVDLLLSDFATIHYGSKPGQTTRVTRYFWEIPRLTSDWSLMESTPSGLGPYTGKEEICYSLGRVKNERITEFGIRGAEAWGKKGVIVSQMANLPTALYLGNFFDNNTNVILPIDSKYLGAIYHFIASTQFNQSVREINQKLDVNTGSMIKCSI